MDDISATISPMREELSFAFIISIYRKYAYSIMNSAACVKEFFEFFVRGVSPVGAVRQSGGRGPTGDRERFCGCVEILTPAVTGAREDARVKIMTWVPAKRGSGEQVGTRPRARLNRAKRSTI